MKKKHIIIVVVILILASIMGGTYYFLTKQDSNTLTVLEKEWIKNNKNNMIDISILDNVPIFNYDGQGLINDFLDDVEKDTGLEFNRISYKKEENTEYSFTMSDTVDKNNILIYSDNYALITKENIKYNNVEDIDEMNVGVLNSDLDKVNTYLNSSKISYSTYDTVDEMIEALTGSDSKIGGIVIPKTMYLETILSHNLYISYNITEMTNNLVLKLGNTKKLNNILTKYYDKWKDNNYDTSFGTYFTQDYYTFTNIDDDTKVNFKSKRYQYGFVTNAPYDKLIDNKLVGYNSEIIKKFSNLTGIEVGYKVYNSYSSLLKDFNSNKLDLFFNQSDNKKYDMDVINSVSIYDEKIVVLSNIDNDITINSINSLKNYEVYTVSDTKINKFLKDNGIKTKDYNNIETLFSKMNKDSILAIDYDSYNTYSKELKNYRVNYTFKLDNQYNYVLRDIKDNKLFNNFFNFYLSFSNTKSILNKVNYKTFEEAEKLVFLRPLIFTLFAVVVLAVITLIVKNIKNKKSDNDLIDKDNKIKYIDLLTSLKNRNYLNQMVEKWDESEIYPQAIVIVDLNNVAYINDNYGHSEGDNVIKEAANILIKNQLENTEIMRTNGNEFLIYLVEYDEKQIVSYIRKLSKEFKELEHGFGAAIGYSMINDGLKTIDDAINEATLDMKANKEENN